ncbi:MAG TPA: acyltransferase [Isosphaeraceae bacterium]|nr:acyltransferase [Isosphaeraceae bacterium]
MVPAAPSISLDQGQPLQSTFGGLKRTLKGIGTTLGLATAALPAASCWLESRLTSRDELFLFWGQAFALVPGLPGKYLRKGFYRLTLQACSLDCDIGFMSYFSDRRTEVGRRVYVGFGVCIGVVSLGEGCLIGNRASIINGGDQHRLGPDGRLLPFDRTASRRVRIGQETWIGESAVIMADVGSRCVVSAGGVVASPIPDGCLVGGNPARFVRKLIETAAAAPAPIP